MGGKEALEGACCARDGGEGSAAHVYSFSPGEARIRQTLWAHQPASQSSQNQQVLGSVREKVAQ